MELSHPSALPPRKPDFRYPALALVILIVLIIFLPEGGYTGDLEYWATWARHIYQYGLPKAYESMTDYLPGQQYLIWLFNHFQSDVDAISRNIHYIKIFALVFDLLSGYVLLLLLRKYISANKALALTLVYALNPFVLYNGYIWGQSDDIYTFFVFLSFYLMVEHCLFWGWLSLLLAINFKLQAAVFLPPLLLLHLTTGQEKVTWAHTVRTIAALAGLQFLILLPFLIGGTAHMIVDVIQHSFNRYPNVSINAYNFWYLTMPADPHDVRDHETWLLGLPYKQWGLLLFFAGSFITLLPLLKNAWKRIRGKHFVTISIHSLLQMFSLIPLLFFYFPTQMHERYAHPALIFIIAYALVSKRCWPAILCCVGYLLNLEDVLKWFALKNYSTFIFDSRFIAALYGLAIVLLFADLLGFKRQKRINHLFDLRK